MESELLTSPPSSSPRTFLDFPLASNLNSLEANIAILGIPFGMPYLPAEMANDQSNAPDAIRQASEDPSFAINNYDFDLGGHLLDGKDIKVVDCGNVVADIFDNTAHYRKAEVAVRKILQANTTLICLGGDHGIPIPVFRALEVIGKKITLVHVDAHLDWREHVNGEANGYSSPIRRASELDWIGPIIQIGMRGTGSARKKEVEDAQNYGCEIITAYEMHDIGIKNVLDRIPNGGPYYLTVDADGLDPTIMPAVMSQTPGGLDWLQIRALVHGLVNKGRVIGMDIVEIAPSRDLGKTTLDHAERLICNFIGATIRAGYYE